MNTIQPESYSQRSFIYRQFSGKKPVDNIFMEVAGGVLTLSTGSVSDAPGLIDLSLVPKAGFRGVNAEQHVDSMGFPVPASPNQAEITSQGEWVLRLSQKEFWLLSHPLQNVCDRLEEYVLPERGCYPLYCQDSHAWFAMTGQHCPDILAKVCGVDLRAACFPVGAIAQTSVARVNAIILHHTIGSEPVFSIMSDSASATYLWGALLDAMAEYEGQIYGLNKLIE
jgi:sarcosine oxidase subunit gamma